jgi:hypothetical protein
MWKEAVVIYGMHLPGGTEEIHEKPVSIAGLRAEIRTRDLLNTKQNS